MKISAKGLRLLKEWEGFSSVLYKDAAGLWTIGVGHLLTRAELYSGRIEIAGRWIDVRHAPMSEADVLELLRLDLKPCEIAVSVSVQVKLNQDQFDALVSFAFNVGVFSFTGSTLLKLLNAGKYDQVPYQLSRWNRAGGQVIQGLVNRRRKEAALWLGQL